MWMLLQVTLLVPIWAGVAMCEVRYLQPLVNMGLTRNVPQEDNSPVKFPQVPDTASPTKSETPGYITVWIKKGTVRDGGPDWTKV